MATYAELSTIAQDPRWDAFTQRIEVACVIKATSLLAGVPTPSQVTWVLETLNSPRGAANQIVWYVIGANESVSIDTIFNAGDVAVQTNVDAAVDAITSV